MRALNFKNTTFRSVPELIKALQQQGFTMGKIGKLVGSTEGYMHQLKGGHSIAGKSMMMRFYQVSGGTLDVVNILKKGNGKRKEKK
jgi:hypothetical protein